MYPPPVIDAVPVGVGAPVPLVTTTETVNGCVVVMVEEDGVTVMAGVAVVTETLADVPAAPLYVFEPVASGV